MNGTKRFLAFLLTMAMVMGMLPTFALAENAAAESAVGAYEMLYADSVTVDGQLTEQAYQYAIALNGNDGTAGLLYAAWNASGIYFGLRQSGAETLTVTVGAHTVTTAAAELFCSWEDIGVKPVDYGFAVPFAAALSGASVSGTLVTSGKTAQVQDLTIGSDHSVSYRKIGSGTVTVSDKTSAAFDISVSGTTRLLHSLLAKVDHTKELLFSQTLCFTELPVSAGQFQTSVGSGNVIPEDGYYFYISYGAPGTSSYSSGPAIAAMIYKGEDGKLYLRDFYNRNDADVVALNKTQNETFRLSVLWGTDASVTYFVDGEAVAYFANGTFYGKTIGQQALNFGYGLTTDGTAAKFTVSDVSLINAEADTTLTATTADILAAAGLNPAGITQDLPKEYTFSERFGPVPLTWRTSDPELVAEDGAIGSTDQIREVTVEAVVTVNDTDVALGEVSISVTTTPVAVVQAFNAEAVTVDNGLREAVWQNSVVLSGETGAPAARVHAAYNNNGLYLGIVYTDAASLTIGSAEAALNGSGTVELLLPWDELTMAEKDYGQSIENLLLTLNGSGGTTKAQLAVVLQSTVETTVAPNSWSRYGSTAENKGYLTADAEKAVWKAEAISGLTKLYASNLSYIDHSKDLLMTQTLTIRDLPVSNGYIINSQAQELCYSFYIVDKDDRGTDGVKDDNGTGIWCTVYRADEEGNLYLRIHQSFKYNANDRAGVPLGKKLGDTFVLSVLWGADDHAEVYVDGQQVAVQENATLIRTAYMGNKCVQLIYEGSTAASIDFTVTKLAFYVPGAETVLEEMTKEAVLGDMDLGAVEENLTLPERFTSAYLGDFDLTWVSSDETVLTNDGVVTRQKTEQTVQLSLYVGDRLVWMEDVTVMANNDGTVIAVVTDAIVLDNRLTESQWLLPMGIAAETEGAPSGKLYAAADQDGVYFGVSYADASQLSVNGKTLTLDGSGEAELLVSWDELGVQPEDYGQKIKNLSVALTGNGGSSGVVVDVVLTNWDNSPVELNTFNCTAATMITRGSNRASWDVSGYDEAAKLYMTALEYADHSSDLLITQTLSFEELPVSNGYVVDSQQADECYYFYLVDKDDRGTDGIKDNDGSAIWCTVYRADEAGNLYLRIHSNSKYGANDYPGFPLGKQLGETFKLTVFWGADDTARVYVDGELVREQANATIVRTAYLGSKCMQLIYRSSSGATARFSVSDIEVTNAGAESVYDEITVDALLDGQNLEDLRKNLELPAVYRSDLLGDVELTWVSSDESLLENDGTIHRGETTQTVQLSLYAGEKLLWTVDVVLGSGSDGTLQLVAADEIVLDHALTEPYWVDMMALTGKDNGPAGSVALVYNRTGIYVGLIYRDAEEVSVLLNGKTKTVSLDGSGVAEFLLTWQELDVEPYDYGQVLTGLKVALTGAAGEAHLTQTWYDVALSSKQVAALKPTDFIKWGNTADISTTDQAFMINSTSKGESKIYLTHIPTVNHTVDVRVNQQICILDLPVGTGASVDSTASEDAYTFTMCYGTTTSTGPATSFAIYRADVEGNLWLRSRNTTLDVPLGKKLGESFQLGMLWKADGGAEFYVDGSLVGSIGNATYHGGGVGIQVIHLSYCGTTPGVPAVFSISDLKLTAATSVTVMDEITAEAVITGASLSNVMANLQLPAVFASPYLGDIALSWSSSDESILTNDGKITRPESEPVTVQLTLTARERELWTVDVTIAPPLPEQNGPFAPSPALANTAFVSEEMTVDGSILEQNWLLNTNILDADRNRVGKFGALWQPDTLYVAVDAGTASVLTLTLNGKTVTVDLSDLSVSGALSPKAIARMAGNDLVELSFAMAELGLTVTGYNRRVPVTADLDGNAYTGELLLTSVDWYAAENEEHPLPVPTKGVSNELLITNPVTENQGVEQLAGGWRFYDLYDENGNNPSLIRTYALLWKDKMYDPIDDSSKTVYAEFDIRVDSLPVYDMNTTVGWSENFASYGFNWLLARSDDAEKKANSVSFGLFNSESGLIFVALTHDDAPVLLRLNKYVGDSFRIGTAWRTDGNVDLYMDGEYYATIDHVETTRWAYGDKTLIFNAIRNETAAASAADNIDLTISNIALGHSYDSSLLDALTFWSIAGNNLKEDQITSDLVLPKTLSDAQLTEPQTVTWTSSDPAVIAADGKVSRPETGAVTVTLTAALADGSSKTFTLRVVGRNNTSGNVLVMPYDFDPATGSGYTTGGYDYTLDANNSSVIVDLLEVQQVSVAVLKDSDSFARLNEENLTLWISDDNVTYTQIKDFKLLHQGQYWYLYDFAAEARYVKVHCTHHDMEDSNFIAPVAQMLTAYDDAYLAGGGTFTEHTAAVTNTTDEERYDFAWTIDGEAQRVILSGELLYHYVEDGKTVVRIPYMAAGETVTLTVLTGNADALDTANKEFVYEVTYGSREAFVNSGAHWIFTLPNGTILSITEKGSMMARCFSYDNGRTWSEYEMISATANFIGEGGGYIYDSVTGRLMFQGSHNVAYNGSDMTKSDCKINIIYSDDYGLTWKQLATVQTDSQYILSYTDGIMLSTYDGDGPNVDFVFPAGAQINNLGGFCCRVAYTTDGGLTWQTGPDKIIYEEGITHEGGVSECTIMEREDGVLVLLGRNQGYGIDNFAQSYSYDHGITWMTPCKLSSVYTVNTQPIMFRHEDNIYLTWGGNNILGGESRVRAPYNIAVTYDGMETFRNIQDIYMKTNLQGLTPVTRNRITNQSVQIAADGSLVTAWWNMTNGRAISNVMTMRVEDFNDYFYRTKGAYDSFEHGTIKYEAWETTTGAAEISDAHASEGDYSMKLTTGTVVRSVPYLQDGTVEMDIYVDGTQSFKVDLQSAYSNVHGKGAPVAIHVVNNAVYFSGSDAFTGLTMQQGWNKLVFEVDLDVAATANATFSLNGSAPVAMPVNLNIGDYICFVTVMCSDEIWVDSFLLEDDQDAKVPGTEPEEPVETFDIAGTTMTLGNDLALNFMVKTTDVTGEGWYAEIAHGDKVTTIAQSEWVVSGNYTRISYNGLAAKQMVDEVVITIYDAKGNELASKTDSIRSYAMRMFGKSKPAFDTVLADMLNYGAAAQVQFNYKTDDLANGQMTEAQKALATEAVEMSNIRETAAGYLGTTLELESNILLNFFYSADFVGKTATVSYTDHYGVAHNYDVEIIASGTYGKVSVDKLVISDCSVRITVTVDGAAVIDSVESYCARMTNLALREPLMKFATSARAYFSK